MGITSVTEVFDGRVATRNRMYERTYQRSFEVITTSPAVGGKVVLAASGIPQIGNYYHNGLDPSDPDYELDHGSFVNDMRANCTGGPEGAGIQWFVTCIYAPYDAVQFGSDPTSWKLRVRFGGERIDKVIYFDKAGLPIRNSAFDRFEDAITIDDQITTMTITQNVLVSAFDLNLAVDFSNTINLNDWNGFTAKHCKMGIIETGDEEYDSNAQVYYYKVTYPVQISRTPWRKELLDQGYNQLDAAYGYGATKAMPILDSKGQPLSEPSALDGFGRKLDIGGSPVKLIFDVFDEVDWATLGLDLSLRLGL